MRRRIAVLTSCMTAALLVCAVAVGSASAAKPRLILGAGGEPAPVGAASIGNFLIGQGSNECVVSQHGRLFTNIETKDILQFGELAEENELCFEANTQIYGTVFETQLSETGTITVKTPKMLVEVPSSEPGLICLYHVTKLTGTFAVPGITDAELTGTGRLAKRNKPLGKVSAPSCESTVAMDGEAQIGDEEAEDKFYETSFYTG
jgi:hypothetical protein